MGSASHKGHSRLWSQAKAPWPLHPQPIPGEILSSWLTRVAVANGMTVQRLCWESWSHRDLLMGDLDRNPPSELLDEMARRSKAPRDALQSMVLSSLEGRLLETFPSRKGWVPWILPASVRKRRSFGTQFCPDCLAEDEKPFFRISWRLGFVTACLRHNRTLLDRCPSCKQGLRSLGLVYGQRRGALFLPIHFCRTCGVDLRSTGVGGCQNADEGVRALQAGFSGAIEEGWYDLPGTGPIPTIPFFRGVHQICKMLCSNGRLGGFREAALDLMSGPPQDLSIVTGRSKAALFEIQSCWVRHRVMVMANWVLQEWPERFIAVCQQAKLPGARVLGDFRGDAPYWISRPVQESLLVRYSRWRQRPQGVPARSGYSELGRIALSSYVADRSGKVEFVGLHPELWANHIELARSLKAAGYYSPKSDPSVIKKSCPRFIALARARQNWRRVAGAISVVSIGGREAFLLVPLNLQ